MKKVSIKQVREDFAGYAESAASGEIIEVTKYNKPYVRIVTAKAPGVTVGDLVFSTVPLKRVQNIGKIALTEIDLKRALEEDRDGSR